jgi:transposase-like protein
MYKNDLSARRYSDAFKLKILDEFSKGKYSKRDLSRLYGIRSSTINDWIKKFDRKDLMNTRIIMEMEMETKSQFKVHTKGDRPAYKLLLKEYYSFALEISTQKTEISTRNIKKNTTENRGIVGNSISSA